MVRYRPVNESATSIGTPQRMLLLSQERDAVMSIVRVVLPGKFRQGRVVFPRVYVIVTIFTIIRRLVIPMTKRQKDVLFI